MQNNKLIILLQDDLKNVSFIILHSDSANLVKKRIKIESKFYFANQYGFNFNLIYNRLPRLLSRLKLLK